MSCLSHASVFFGLISCRIGAVDYMEPKKSLNPPFVHLKVIRTLKMFPEFLENTANGVSERILTPF